MRTIVIHERDASQPYRMQGRKTGLLVACCCCLFAVVLALTGTAHAVILKPGDILVADIGPTQNATVDGRIIHIDPVTGVQTVVTSEVIDPTTPLLRNAFDLVLDSDNQILVADRVNNSTGRVVSVDPVTGEQTLIRNTAGAVSIALESDGNILFGTQSPAQIRRLTPDGTSDTLVTSGGDLNAPAGLALAGNGDIYVADLDSGGLAGDHVLKVDPGSGVQTIVSALDPGNDLFGDPRDLVFETSDQLLVLDSSSPTDPDLRRIIRVDLNAVSDEQTVVFSVDKSELLNPRGIALEADGSVLVTDAGNSFLGEAPAVYRIDLETGTQTLLAQSGDLNQPHGIFVVPGASAAVPEPTTLTLLAATVLLAVRRRR